MIALVLCFAYFIPVNAAEEIEETAYLEEYDFTLHSLLYLKSGENLTRNTAVRTCSASLAISGSTATVSSGTYRVKVVCTAGGESITIYSATKTK